MKTITIGRGEGCDIQIDDYRISRRHAILKVYTFGKMEIVDMGKNGTWVNGIKLRPGVPFPVKRKDVVNFAEASQLNWNYVYNPTKYLKWASIAIVVLLLLVLGLIMICTNKSSSTDESYQYPPATEQPKEGNIEKDSLPEKKLPSVSSKDDNGKKELKNDIGKANFPNASKGAKTAEELFPQRTNVKKNDSTKSNKKDDEKRKSAGKKTEGKKSEGKKSEDNSKRVHVII